MNPYALIKQKLVACLKIEAKLTEQERDANQFSFLTKLGSSQITVLKGGVNTIAIQLGKGERKVMYPDDALVELDKLAKRPYWYYTINGTTVFGIAKIVKTPPTKMAKIIGVGPKGEKVLYTAKPTLSGGLQWVESK